MVGLHESGIVLFDTHGGVGQYALENTEYTDGIGRLVAPVSHGDDFPSEPCPQPVKDYIEMVEYFNEGHEIKRYPGSPAIAELILRLHDEHCIWELNPPEYEALFLTTSANVKVSCGDGFAGVISELSSDRETGTKTPVVLIDPPYKDAREYSQVTRTFERLLTKRPDTTVMVWLARLDLPESRELEANLVRLAKLLATSGYLEASLTVASKGLMGSSMLVANPPDSLRSDLEAALPWLAKALKKDCSHFSLVPS